MSRGCPLRRPSLTEHIGHRAILPAHQICRELTSAIFFKQPRPEAVMRGRAVSQCTSSCDVSESDNPASRDPGGENQAGVTLRDAAFP
jgi:hypothetical protein